MTDNIDDIWSQLCAWEINMKAVHQAREAIVQSDILEYAELFFGLVAWFVVNTDVVYTEIASNGLGYAARMRQQKMDSHNNANLNLQRRTSTRA